MPRTDATAEQAELGCLVADRIDVFLAAVAHEDHGIEPTLAALLAGYGNLRRLTSAEAAAWPPVAECRRRVSERLGLPADLCLAVGVDRFDYTKGILERLNAVERLLEKERSLGADLKFVTITSAVTVVDGVSLAVTVTPSSATKCERCWHYTDDVGHHAAHPTLCGRCVSNIAGAGETRAHA